MTVSEVALLIGSKAFFKRAVTDVYDVIAKKTGGKIKQWNTERKIENLWKKIGQVRNVKTIWQVDKAVDLGEFYCDSHVLINKKRLRVHQLADFNTKDNILIQGIAGQGKSIFLRYLCSVELGLGNYIPIFLELRRISKDHTLRDRIFLAFKSLGLNVDSDLFEALADSGKILLLLDAFDEIPDDLKLSVLTDIEDLASTHENLRFIVTSRPENHIQMSNQFTIVNLDDLQGKEYEAVINKLAAGESWADLLLKHIEERATHIRTLLFTPLMVTLLVLSYKSYKKLPDKMADFYDSLFQTLLQRHDGTKPGFIRERGCLLDDVQYRKAFEAICILAKKKKQQSFSYSTMNELAENALKQCSLSASPEHLVRDIIKITCLILRDGEEHRFIHKTVQEYYTAAFVAKQPEPWANIFYSRVLQEKVFGEWSQELAFLSEIDMYRYNRYFFLPAMLDFLQIKENALDHQSPCLTSKKALSILKGLSVSMESDGKLDGFRVTVDQTWWLLEGSLPKLFDFIRKEKNFDVISNAYNEILSRRNNEEHDPGPFELKRVKGLFVEFSEIIQMAGMTDGLVKIYEKDFLKIFQKAKKLRNTLRTQENPYLLDGLV